MAVNPDKDVDGFHPVNVGKMALDLPTFLPDSTKGLNFKVFIFPNLVLMISLPK